MSDAGRAIPLYEQEDTQPLSESEHAKLLQSILEWQQAADRFRKPLVDEWRRCYLMYRSFVTPRKAGEWRSRIFIPISFHVIETGMPKLISQLPQPIVLPVGPEDVDSARKMEDRLKWAFDQSDLWYQLVLAYRSACKYGTGIIKVYPGRLEGWEQQEVPTFEEQTFQEEVPVLGPDGAPMLDIDGAPLTQVSESTEQVQTGSKMVRVPFDYYVGPIAEALDLEDVWVSPEATSIEDSRYVIHRVWREMPEIKERVKDGTYRLPEGTSLDDMWDREENPALQRQGELGLSSEPDPNRRAVEVWEVWTRTGEQITVLNQRLVVRLAPNPFAHGHKPFVRVLDHLQEHEFYGVGELAPILGIQDAINALWNSRIENVRLVLQRVFAVNPDNLWDMRDLRLEPGKAIRIRSSGGINPADLLFPIDMPDVTGSAYEEVSELIGLVERVLSLSVSGDEANSAWNQTATGVAITTETGNSRFALKVRMAELTGLVPLTLQFGSLLQQYTPQEMWIRREGAEGGFEFDQDEQGNPVPTDAAAIQGQFDYDIEAGSMSQTDSFRKELDMTLFNLLAGRADAQGVPLANDRELVKDLLRSWGKKDIERLVVDPATFMSEQMQQLPPELAGMGMGAPMPAEAGAF